MIWLFKPHYWKISMTHASKKQWFSKICSIVFWCVLYACQRVEFWSISCLFWHFCSSHPHFSSSNPMFFSCIPYFTQLLCLNLPFSILNPSYTMFFRTWQNHPVVCKLHSPFPVWKMVSSFPHVFSLFSHKICVPTKSQCSIMFPWFVFPMFLP